MVEGRALLIGPWERTSEADQESSLGTWIRRVSDGENGTYLGFAVWQPADRGTFSSWLGRRHIILYETEDASLVMTLRRGFWRVWEVFDSEECPVGTLYRNVLLDAAGGTLARPRWTRSGQGGTYLDAQGQVLAHFDPSNSAAWRVTFPEQPSTTPFARMVLLAAVFAWGPEPG